MRHGRERADAAKDKGSDAARAAIRLATLEKDSAFDTMVKKDESDTGAPTLCRPAISNHTVAYHRAISG